MGVRFRVRKQPSVQEGALKDRKAGKQPTWESRQTANMGKPANGTDMKASGLLRTAVLPQSSPYS